MIYWKLFWAFFIPGIVGYGGGPAAIPLIQHEVVNHYHWLTQDQFKDLLALGNTLPGPIATKMAGYVGYEIAGPLGAIVALFATVGPSLLAMIFLLALLYRYRRSPKVERMTMMIRPVVGILLALMAFDFFDSSLEDIGFIQTFFLSLASLLLMEKWNVHPAWVIAGSLVYGFFFLA
ncbi:chromate transporter [Paenactinomyces guangxiensis]|uniref:Chromate transporter n=1 Tax=Paenactinomyces guangxiensis TaxID=1490290 RepID=A0A7W1WRC4_9BACL|nr:chromate transporter [Paenactinomyces guangxiensis]MBA4494663.1 chromate transporter [Paenactinomyces guangxiensis]MBH8591747.1 chromate transporter [Paenactinomyces guangxiensis]